MVKKLTSTSSNEIYFLIAAVYVISELTTWSVLFAWVWRTKRLLYRNINDLTPHSTDGVLRVTYFVAHPELS